MYHDREAELKARVDRRRVRIMYAGSGEPATVLRALSVFRDDLRVLAAPESEATILLDTECEATRDPEGIPGART